MNIRAVIFDFGGVICHPPDPAQWRDAAEFCGAGAAAFESAYWKDRSGYDEGGDAREYWREVGGRLGIAFDAATIAGLIEREIGFWSRFDRRVLQWIGELRNAGFGTGILSNLPRPLGESLRSRPGFLGHFDEVTFSYELGVVKPDAAIYRSAVQGLRIAPGDALFLDDRPANVEGARATGLAAEVFTSWEDFVANARAAYGLPPPA